MQINTSSLLYIIILLDKNRHLLSNNYRTIFAHKQGKSGLFSEINTFIVDDNKSKPFYYDYILTDVLKNADPSEVILFEDVNKYLQEGKKRGFVTIGIQNGFGKEKIEADYVIDATKEEFTLK